ncbi:MAG: hypothetical protein AAGG48_11465 [Planctomycetota bacterium]
MANKTFTIRLMLLVVLSLALSFATFRFGTVAKSPLLASCGLGGFFASIGWPIGYFIDGRSGAYYGAMIGVGFLFVMILLMLG